MERDEIVKQILGAWRRNNEILIYLLGQIPPRGLKSAPAGSRGRNVAAQFLHLHRARVSWLAFHTKSGDPRPPKYDKEKPPTKSQLKKWLTVSGKRVEAFITLSLDGEAKPQMFDKQIVRWMVYLVAHDSHHRGQILLALKQSGIKLPQKVAIDGVWGKWVFGK